MNIYFLDRRKGCGAGFDQMNACVVIAPDEKAARRLASGRAGGELARAWQSRNVVITLLGAAAEGLTASVVCEDVAG